MLELVVYILQKKYLQIKPNENIIIFEGGPKVGGRIRTLEDNVDRGAWRVHDSHNRMINLADELDINLIPTHSSNSAKTYDDILKINKKSQKRISGLSTLQSNIVNDGLSIANIREQRTGYLGLSDGIEKSYTINKHTGIFKVPENGMEEYPKKLYESLPKTVTVNFKTRVVHIDKIKDGNNVKYVIKTQNLNEECEEWECNTLILNCQPIHLPSSNFGDTIELVKGVLEHVL